MTARRRSTGQQAVDTNAADGWTSAGVVDPGARLANPVNLAITQNGNDLLLSGKLWA